MSSSAPRVWKVIKPHLPLIKFKKGGTVRTHAGVVSADTNQSQPSAPPIGSTPRGSGIDEALMPKRYQRKPISALEIRTIESGGSETL